MKRKTSTRELKAHLGEILDAIRLRGDHYIIERQGKAVAALVPLSLVERDERQRCQLFDLIDAVHEQNRGVSPEQLDSAIEQAIAEVRHPSRPTS